MPLRTARNPATLTVLPRPLLKLGGRDSPLHPGQEGGKFAWQAGTQVGNQCPSRWSHPPPSCSRRGGPRSSQLDSLPQLLYPRPQALAPTFPLCAGPSPRDAQAGLKGSPVSSRSPMPAKDAPPLPTLPHCIRTPTHMHTRVYIPAHAYTHPRTCPHTHEAEMRCRAQNPAPGPSGPPGPPSPRTRECGVRWGLRHLPSGPGRWTGASQAS